MIRQEYVLIGCIVVFIGLALCVVGYNKTEPTNLDNAVTFVAGLSGQAVPTELRQDKTSGYFLIVGGGVCILIGLVFILKSRTAANLTTRVDSGDKQ